MIKLEGVHLKASNIEELHKFAARIVVSKSWFHFLPEPHYDIISPFKIKMIVDYIKNQRNRHE